MAHLTLVSRMDARNQILSMPDTEMKKLLLEVFRLLDVAPTIRQRVQDDLDRAARAGKKTRLVDAVDRVSGVPTLPGMEVMTVQEARSLDSEGLVLGIGRPRALDGEAICVLAMCRAHLDSVTSKTALDRLHDSMTLRAYLEGRGMSMPSRSTMHAGVNCISKATYEYILDAQLAMVLHEGLDRFDTVTADSFSVWANTSWPTESATIHGLLARAWAIASKLSAIGVPSFAAGPVSLWLDRLRSLDRQIAFACGKPNSKRKIRRLYKKLFGRAELLLRRLDRQFERLLPAWQSAVASLPVRARDRVGQKIDQMMCDLAAAARVVAYSRTRVVDGESVPMSEKVLSLSDGSAAYIKKGERDPVIGYKPQVMRSRNGFVTAFELQQGNPNDAARLVPLTQQHIKRTGLVPGGLSVDDGYSSASNRAVLLGMSIRVVSMNGAKGKKLTPDCEWDSPDYEQARDDRSAVESLVFTLRYKFHLYRFSRRGVEDVEIEMYEKIIAHNLWRASLLREHAAAHIQAARPKAA